MWFEASRLIYWKVVGAQITDLASQTLLTTDY